MQVIKVHENVCIGGVADQKVFNFITVHDKNKTV